ncbi:probable calcium-binding protein CML46 [Cornus florida]|uniref:probable calcium-binding protein CML46 n=1 Tax=Cornus florida TaxID=4283 RepID=UPI0028991403|nr:probable calcium-binding protein CML46 [Cornus florida]
MEKISLDTIPLSCIMFGFLQYYYLYVILDQLRRFYEFFLTSNSLIQSHLAVQADREEKNPECSELLSKHLPCRKEKISDENLCREDIEMVMGRLGVFGHSELGEEKVQERRFDSNDISNLFEEEEPSLEEVKAAFDVFDENRDGFIDASELQRVFCVLGFKHGGEMEDCRKMIKAFDNNGDGRIDFNEFVIFMETSFC